MKTLTAVLAVMASAIGASACADAKAVEARPLRPIKAYTVRPAPAAAGVRYSATIEAFEQISLAFKTSGYVEALDQRRGADGRSRAAQAGDQVAKGTVLARVEDADYRERLNQSRAKLAEGEASEQKARLDRDRAEALFAADSLIKPDLDAARANFDAARARVAATQAEAAQAANALRDTALAAPSAGVVLERRVEVGTLVAAGSVAYVLGDIASVKARFGIPDSMIDAITLGEQIEVVVDALAGSTLSGYVTKLAPAADPQSRVFDVEITIRNRDGRLRPGMIGTVAFGGDAAEAVERPLTVPLNAVVKTDGESDGYAVFALERGDDGDIARARRVQLGDVTGNGVVVTSGISVGDRVVVSGAALLADGDRVRVIP
jgi:membrane fusion protein, multidrug efflux system